MDDAAASPSDLRRKQILAAAFDGFVRHGYSKITMQDVALAVGVSRPLIYTFYRGKEDLFLAMFEAVFADQLRRVNEIARCEAPARSRLIDIFEIVYLELWDRLMSSAEGADLLDAATRLFPKIAEKARCDLAGALCAILENEADADHLLLAGKGMSYDRPPTQVLRARLTAIIDIFLAAGTGHEGRA